MVIFGCLMSTLGCLCTLMVIFVVPKNYTSRVIVLVEYFYIEKTQFFSLTHLVVYALSW